MFVCLAAGGIASGGILGAFAFGRDFFVEYDPVILGLGDSIITDLNTTIYRPPWVKVASKRSRWPFSRTRTLPCRAWFFRDGARVR